jgi:hypothetical protein
MSYLSYTGQHFTFGNAIFLISLRLEKVASPPPQVETSTPCRRHLYSSGAAPCIDHSDLCHTSCLPGDLDRYYFIVANGQHQYEISSRHARCDATIDEPSHERGNHSSRSARAGGERWPLAALNNSQMQALAAFNKAPLQIATFAESRIG